MIREQVSVILAQSLNYDKFPHTNADEAAVANIMRVVFVVIGAVSILMVVIGGIKYSAAQGDSQAVSKAKGTIIYAIVGLIVSIFAVTIVSFVAGRVG